MTIKIKILNRTEYYGFNFGVNGLTGKPYLYFWHNTVWDNGDFELRIILEL